MPVEAGSVATGDFCQHFLQVSNLSILLVIVGPFLVPVAPLPTHTPHVNCGNLLWQASTVTFHAIPYRDSFSQMFAGSVGVQVDNFNVYQVALVERVHVPLGFLSFIDVCGAFLENKAASPGSEYRTSPRGSACMPGDNKHYPPH